VKGGGGERGKGSERPTCGGDAINVMQSTREQIHI